MKILNEIIFFVEKNYTDLSDSTQSFLTNINLKSTSQKMNLGHTKTSGSKGVSSTSTLSPNELEEIENQNDAKSFMLTSLSNATTQSTIMMEGFNSKQNPPVDYVVVNNNIMDTSSQKVETTNPDSSLNKNKIQQKDIFQRIISFSNEDDEVHNRVNRG